MRIVLLEHPRIPSAHHFNDIANTPLWSCLMTGYAAASLLNAGHDAKILDATSAPFEVMVNRVMETPSDVLAVHAVYFWENTERLFDALVDIRKKGYSGVICLFGFFPTLAWEDLLLSVSAIDCVVVGEPEKTLVELANSIPSGKRVPSSPGLAARFEGQPRLPGFRTPTEQVDSIPFPVRPFLEAEETVNILASRGCYNGCSFCLIPTLNGGRARWRGRSATNVVAEIGELAARGKRDFYFADPNFVGPGKSGTEHAIELSRSLADLGITFGMETRANDVTHPLLRSLRDAGLTSLLLGIESGNSRVLKRIRKRTSVTDNEQAIATVRDIGIEPEIGFIMFDPLSTIEDIKENLAFLTRNRLLDRLGRTANLLYHSQIAFKGTPGYRIAADQGRLAPEGFYGFEGRLLYEDWRVGWLAGGIKQICKHIIREMGMSSSLIRWNAEDAGGGFFQEVNEGLVQVFRKMLDTAAHLGSRPEASWTRAELDTAFDEVNAALSGISQAAMG